MSEPERVLMAIHAHPDDEAIGTGGILKKYASQGVRTILVLATKGEAGEIGGRVPVGEERALVPNLRLQELRCSCAILGVDRVHYLGYHDSGMAGTPDNKLPGTFFMADPEEAIERLVKIIREEKPHVITTYDENGSYGHPDHIKVNQVTLGAFESAGNANRFPHLGLDPWQPLKLYYQAIPTSRIQRMGAVMSERANQLNVDPDIMGTQDEAISTWIDVRGFLKEKFAAIQCHGSQIGENSFFSQFTEGQREELFGFECFILVRSQRKLGLKETDLFEGLD